MISCKKFVQVSTPAGESTTPQVFSSDASATAAMNGVYSLMMGSNDGFADGALTLYPGLSADELYNTVPDPNLSQFAQNTLTSGNPIIASNCWAGPYSYLYQVNAILEALQTSTSISAPVKAQLMGEAHCVRALLYFYMDELYDGVPLVTGTDYTVNAALPRATSADVYTQIVNDLVNATALLTTQYPTQGPLRPNKYVAEALLARVYLYEGDWTDAAAESSIVIEDGGYQLVPILDSVFNAYSPEAIWQLTPVVPGFNTFEGYDFIPADSTTVPAYAVDTALLNAFEPGDRRKASWLGYRTIGGQVYAYPYKYQIQAGITDRENEMVLRLAEQYLIRAEARTNMGDINGAQLDLDSLRARAGLPPTSATNATELQAAIAHERRVELCFEWGHRWFDLKRTGKADSVLAAEKPGWRNVDTLYPIPLSQLQANTSLTQNNGY